jgi:hypothetical protein
LLPPLSAPLLFAVPFPLPHVWVFALHFYEYRRAGGMLIPTAPPRRQPA